MHSNVSHCCKWNTFQGYRLLSRWWFTNFCSLLRQIYHFFWTCMFSSNPSKLSVSVKDLSFFTSGVSSSPSVGISKRHIFAKTDFVQKEEAHSGHQCWEEINYILKFFKQVKLNDSSSFLLTLSVLAKVRDCISSLDSLANFETAFPSSRVNLPPVEADTLPSQLPPSTFLQFANMLCQCFVEHTCACSFLCIQWHGC